MAAAPAAAVETNTEEFIFCIRVPLDGRLAYKVVAHGDFADLDAACAWAEGAGEVLKPELEGSNYVHVLPLEDGFTTVRVND